MKASELRLGNLVNVPRKDQSPFRIDAFESLSNSFIKVAMIHPEHGEKFHPLTWYGDDLKPIPLTEEWLLNFGFNKYIGWDDMDFWCLLNDGGKSNRFELYETNQGFESPSGKIIEYVHTLQNCYFFHELSGEELTLKTT
jgi:hypothetical protein